MNLESDKRLNIQLRLDFSSAPTGEARQAGREDIESLSVVSEPERPANACGIMEEVCERENLKAALRQVRSNKGSAGVDGMTVDKLGDYLKQHWPVIREQLLNGIYEPRPVRGGNLEAGWGRFCKSNGTRRFPNTATGFDRVGRRITLWLKRSGTSRKATDGRESIMTN
jgi:hypothetical protein